MKYQLRRPRLLSGFKWTWRLRASNGEILCHGEHYSRRKDAESAIEQVQSSWEARIEVL